MDKEEYKVRLETIRTLAGDGDFKTAAEVADSVDWKRVKNVRTLCMIAEIYEANGRYEDTNRILQYAYWRAHVSKTVLYRLTEVNIRTGHFEEAQKYCDEFELLSPKDSTKYILRYKLMSARGDALEEQIKVLEAYRENEFTEKWAYELAKLYKENGENEKCVALCDDMILWFAKGKYVSRAMELKMEIMPLTADQQRKFDQRSDDDEDEEKTEYGFAQTEKERVSSIRQADLPDAFRMGESDIQTRLADGIRAVFAGIRPEEKRHEAAAPEKEPESYAGSREYNIRDVRELEPEKIGLTTVTPPPLRMEEPEIEGQMTIDDYMKEKPAGEEEHLDELLSETRANLASAVASGRYEKVGVRRDGEKAAEAAPEAPESSPETAEADRSAEEEAAAALEAMRRKMDPYERLYGKETDESLGLTRQFNLSEEIEKAFKEGTYPFSEREDERHRRALEQTLRSAGVLLPEEPAKAAVTAAGVVSGAAAAAAEHGTEEERKAAVRAALDASHAAPAEDVPVDGVILGAEGAEEGAAKAADEAERFAAAEADGEAFAEDAGAAAGIADAADEAADRKGAAGFADAADAVADFAEAADAAEGFAEAAGTAEDRESAASSGETDDIIESIIREPDVFKKVPMEPRPFDDVEKEIFTYFTRVPGMSDQITMALNDIHNNAGDRTSRSGNVMIIGRQGAGKTRLADALVLSAARDLGLSAVRAAKIIAADLNNRNAAEVVSKLMGGFLIIEGAGELSDETVGQLLLAMEFRTDDLVVILEDEKADLKALLLRHPEIEDKFTSTIVIPVFTNDELVGFARSYAREKGYRMDEMGVLALYTMIGDNQSATEPMTVGRVKAMMDAAIAKADSGTRRIGRRFSKRALSPDGRIILREKDFDY